jgi:hypothetical protein
MTNPLEYQQWTRIKNAAAAEKMTLEEFAAQPDRVILRAINIGVRSLALLRKHYPAPPIEDGAVKQEDDMAWTLLGTLALAIFPLVKPKVDPDKARIAELEAEVARLRQERDYWHAERDAWQRAYAERAARSQNQFSSPSPTQQAQARPQMPHVAQWQGQAFQNLRVQTFPDWTCVPERSAALRPGTPD